MPETRHCIQCGKEFKCSPSRSTQHCSDKCARKTQAEKMIKWEKRKCVHCGNYFRVKPSNPKITCSYKCLCNLRKGREPGNKLPRKSIKCEFCGNTFEDHINSKRKFCSKECVDHSKRGKKPYNYNKITLQCKQCGKEYKVTRFRKDNSNFCSHKCNSQYKKTITGKEHPLYDSIERKCQWCGKIFLTKPAKVKAGEGKFCSRSCLGSHTTKHIGGKRSSLEVKVEKIITKIGLKYDVQKQIGPWLVDFYLPKHNLVIECDGDYWHSLERSVKRDKQKNWWMWKNNYNLLRLKECDINTKGDKWIKETIFKECCHEQHPINDRV